METLGQRISVLPREIAGEILGWVDELSLAVVRMTLLLRQDDLSRFRESRFAYRYGVGFFVWCRDTIELIDISYNVGRWGTVELVKLAGGLYTCNGAASTGNIEVLRYAHSLGILLNNACDVAAKCGHMEIVQFLVGVRCKMSGATVVAAAESGRLDLVQYLIDAGCSVDEAVMDGAVDSGRLEIVQYLIDIGCDFYTTSTIIVAAKRGYLDIVQYLYQCGCEGNVRVTCSAAEAGSLDVVRFCCENDFGVNSSVMRCAVRSGSLEMVKYLHQFGCSWDFDFLDAAVLDGRLDIVQYCYEHGCPQELVIWIF
jgi:hypothetical protein